jgi:hypothetical protein
MIPDQSSGSDDSGPLGAAMELSLYGDAMSLQIRVRSGHERARTRQDSACREVPTDFQGYYCVPRSSHMESAQWVGVEQSPTACHRSNPATSTRSLAANTQVKTLSAVRRHLAGHARTQKTQDPRPGAGAAISWRRRRTHPASALLDQVEELLTTPPATPGDLWSSGPKFEGRSVRGAGADGR